MRPEHQASSNKELNRGKGRPEIGMTLWDLQKTQKEIAKLNAERSKLKKPKT